ncbi:M48 family metallopeptidase [Streptacidiphilus sp. N1-10]|uniref:M48 family metallopeptidase n=1 Tax=Streptacidiphilus jeojiensis TaxID=3229225 RepID=A0ABV6XTB5_9ACTN
MTTPPTISSTTPTCKNCGSTLTTDPRFTQWCTSCGWNALPDPQPEPNTAAAAAEEKLYRAVTGAGDLRPHRDGAWFGALAIACAVHALSLATLAFTVWLLIPPAGFTARILGVILLAAAVILRPRLGSVRRLRKSGRVLDRTAAPALYAVTDRVAAHLGCSPAHLIIVNGRFNASYARIGLRRRSVLTLGLPLWETLTPQQRIALLGHEFGHSANGDSRRGLWIGTALQTLDGWRDVLAPADIQLPRGGLDATVHWIVRWALACVNWLVARLQRLLHRLTLRSGRRAEYLADALAVRTAGSDAAIGLTLALTRLSSVQFVLNRRRGRVVSPRRRRGEAPPVDSTDLWEELREYLSSVPESERARQLRVSELEGSTSDSSHPPTYLRVAFLRQLPATEPTIVVEPEQWTAVDHELAPLRAQVAKRLS